MANIGQMNFFKVNECGLYKVGSDKPHGCELTETFHLFQEWAKDLPMSSTIPWDPSAITSKSKCYCRDVYHDPHTGDFLIVLWKSDTDSTGSLWGAAEDEKTGAGEVVKYANEHKGKKVIWGRPCYYWVIPKLQSVVSLKFDHSVCDSQLFQEYVAACITNRIPHPNRVKSFTEGGFVRLSYADDVDQYRYTYRFDVSLRSLDTSNAELSNLAHRVTHVVRRETIRVDVADQRADWVKKFDKMPFISAKPKSRTRQLEIKAEAKPTVKEVKEIIEQYAKGNRKSSDWDNVGFCTDTGITWVDRYRLKDQLVLTDNRVGVLPAKYLLGEIHKQRSKFVAPILKSLKELKGKTA